MLLIPCFYIIFVFSAANIGKKVRTHQSTDKWSDGFRQIIGWFQRYFDENDNPSDKKGQNVRGEKLSFRLLVGGGGHAVLGAEVAGEGVGTGEAAGLTDLLDSEVGLVVQQANGIVEAQFADVCRQ